MTDTVKKKYIPRGPSATKAKRKFGNENYDRMELNVPKGMKAKVVQTAKEQGYPSYTSFTVAAIKEKYLRDYGTEMTWEKEE